MFCKNCGKEINKNTNFCIYCGTKINDDNNELLKTTNINNNNKTKCKYYIIRCFFGYAMILGGVVHLLIQEMSVLYALSFILLGFTISPLCQDKIYGKKRLILGIIAFILFGIFTPKENNTKTKNNITQINEVKNVENNEINIINNTDSKQQSAKPNVVVQPSYDKGVLSIIPLQKGNGYDKTLNTYGINGVKKINQLLPQMAELVSKSPECDSLTNVAHSDKGTPKNIIIFADCKNQKRFIMNEEEIKLKKQPISNQTKFEVMKYDLIELCDEFIKTQLNHPSTFKKSHFNSTYYVGITNLVVRVSFSAKNSFNLKLNYEAVCYFDQNGKLADFAMKESN